MLLGVDYYPEQWDSALIEADMDRILELGCNVIRIGEFAWHRMEPEEGRFDFSFFDGVIAMAKEKGLQVIFGTPTATPPAWLIHKHPDILSQFPDGSSRAFGGRHVSCYSSQPYREYCARIITQLAEHYKDEKTIVAWQIDNELGHEGSDQCWCPRCRAKFQHFLNEKFKGDIHALNETYGTAFWSQEYNSFAEIPLPAPNITSKL
ncbi:beta-galactosidase, partial [Pseudoflavonifractor phocaeensis]|uniref:beta-galactosidase n=1 Tax=Pseudoflavonifractor phocaeensis TaxID=1870988 RepID=UPI0025A40313